MSKLEQYKSLTKEYLLSRLDYDAENGLLYWKDIPQNRKSARPGKFINPIGKGWTQHIQFSLDNKKLHVHRVIFFLEYGYHPEIIDHIDRNHLNNHISNLRPSDRCLNRLNSDGKGYDTDTYKDGSPRFKVRLTVRTEGLTKSAGTYKNETVAKFAAWWLRELMYPGIVECPEFSEDEENALLRIMENYSPLRP